MLNQLGKKLHSQFTEELEVNRTALAHNNTEQFSPFSSGILQRKCTTCANKTTAEEECSGCASKKAKLQRKLSIGASNDPLEHEADRVADQVMSMTSNSGISNISPRIQRAPTNSGGSDFNVPDSVNKVLNDSGQRMQSSLRQDMEQRFGRDFSQVRLHTGSAAEQSARDVNAHAYTVGQNIVFGSGQFSSETAAGRHLLAHELVHTVQQSPNVIRRQVRSACNVSQRSAADQVNVRCGENDYRVDVDIVTGRTARTETSTNLGINGTAITLDIEICRGGTVVNIRPSINLPQALREIVGNVVSGTDALDGVTITPELRVNLIQSRKYAISLSGGPVVDIGSGEVVGGQGNLRIDTPRARIEFGVEGQNDQVTGNLRVTPGNFRPEERNCTRRTRRIVMRCRNVSVTPAVPARPEERRNLRREVYLLFPYARSTPVREVLSRTGNARPTTTSASELSALATQGYQVQSIEGFASPEGPRSQSRSRRFIGNIQLAENRAISAQEWLNTNCSECGGVSVQPQGRSELYSPSEDPEIEGNALTEFATNEFVEQDDPFSPDTDAERDALRQSSLRARRDAIYPQLRRARIVFERSVLVRPAVPAIPAREELTPTRCPAAVLDAVRNHYGVNSIL